MTRSQTLLVAEVQLKEQDGSFHAYSDELPGLHICGIDRDEVLEDVILGIKFLYKEVHGINIEARWADSPAAVTYNKARPAERVVMQASFS